MLAVDGDNDVPYLEPGVCRRAGREDAFDDEALDGARFFFGIFRGVLFGVTLVGIFSIGLAIRRLILRYADTQESSRKLCVRSPCRCDQKERGEQSQIRRRKISSRAHDAPPPGNLRILLVARWLEYSIRTSSFRFTAPDVSIIVTSITATGCLQT